MAEQIYTLIGQAMRKIGAIGKDSVNTQQKYKFRGIDSVYNALNPVMSELGLFICPEILEQRREERTTKSGTALNYSILTVKYTVYASDGSHVECTVIGEGMDSGDKASNKAMAIAMKYAMFQVFCIPTGDDPDAETHNVAEKKITKEQATTLMSLLSAKFTDEQITDTLKGHYKVNTAEELNEKQYAEILRKVKGA